jgi:hypothetical protein
MVPCPCESAINKVTYGRKALYSTRMLDHVWAMVYGRLQPCKEPFSDSIMNRSDEARSMFQALFVIQAFGS